MQFEKDEQISQAELMLVMQEELGAQVELAHKITKNSDISHDTILTLAAQYDVENFRNFASAPG